MGQGAAFNGPGSTSGDVTIFKETFEKILYIFYTSARDDLAVSNTAIWIHVITCAKPLADTLPKRVRVTIKKCNVYFVKFLFKNKPRLVLKN